MGELARKPGCPKLAETPLELLTPRPGEGFGLIDKYLWPVTGAAMGIFVPVATNYMLRRPIWAGIHKHFLLGGIFYYAGTFVCKIRNEAKAEADEALKHYITLHPEDFPPFDRKRWSDIYQPFRPVR